MICPFCENRTRVASTIPHAAEVNRRRVCPVCNRRFNTVERLTDDDLGVQAKARRVMRETLETLNALQKGRDPHI